MYNDLKRITDFLKNPHFIVHLIGVKNVLIFIHSGTDSYKLEFCWREHICNLYIVQELYPTFKQTTTTLISSFLWTNSFEIIDLLNDLIETIEKQVNPPEGDNIDLLHKLRTKIMLQIL